MQHPNIDSSVISPTGSTPCTVLVTEDTQVPGKNVFEDETKRTSLQRVLSRKLRRKGGPKGVLGNSISGKVIIPLSPAQEAATTALIECCVHLIQKPYYTGRTLLSYLNSDSSGEGFEYVESVTSELSGVSMGSGGGGYSHSGGDINEGHGTVKEWPHTAFPCSTAPGGESGVSPIVTTTPEGDTRSLSRRSTKEGERVSPSSAVPGGMATCPSLQTSPVSHAAPFHLPTVNLLSSSVGAGLSTPETEGGGRLTPVQASRYSRATASTPLPVTSASVQEAPLERGAKEQGGPRRRYVPSEHRGKEGGRIVGWVDSEAVHPVVTSISPNVEKGEPPRVSSSCVTRIGRGGWRPPFEPADTSTGTKTPLPSAPPSSFFPRPAHEEEAEEEKKGVGRRGLCATEKEGQRNGGLPMLLTTGSGEIPFRSSGRNTGADSGVHTSSVLNSHRCFPSVEGKEEVPEEGLLSQPFPLLPPAPMSSWKLEPVGAGEGPLPSHTITEGDTLAALAVSLRSPSTLSPVFPLHTEQHLPPHSPSCSGFPSFTPPPPLVWVTKKEDLEMKQYVKDGADVCYPFEQLKDGGLASSLHAPSEHLLCSGSRSWRMGLPAAHSPETVLHLLAKHRLLPLFTYCLFSTQHPIRLLYFHPSDPVPLHFSICEYLLPEDVVQTLFRQLVLRMVEYPDTTLVDWTQRVAGHAFPSWLAIYQRLSLVWPLLRVLPYFSHKLQRKETITVSSPVWRWELETLAAKQEPTLEHCPPPPVDETPVEGPHTLSAAAIRKETAVGEKKKMNPTRESEKMKYMKKKIKKKKKEDNSLEDEEWEEPSKGVEEEDWPQWRMKATSPGSLVKKTRKGTEKTKQAEGGRIGKNRNSCIITSTRSTKGDHCSSISSFSRSSSPGDKSAVASKTKKGTGTSTCAAIPERPPPTIKGGPVVMEGLEFTGTIIEGDRITGDFVKVGQAEEWKLTKEIVQYYVQKGVDIFLRTPYMSQSIVEEFISRGKLDCVTELLSTSLPLDFTRVLEEGSGNTLLHILSSERCRHTDVACEVLRTIRNRLKRHPGFDTIAWGKRNLAGDTFLSLSPTTNRLSCFWSVVKEQPFFVHGMKPIPIAHSVDPEDWHHLGATQRPAFELLAGLKPVATPSSSPDLQKEENHHTQQIAPSVSPLSGPFPLTESPVTFSPVIPITKKKKNAESFSCLSPIKSNSRSRKSFTNPSTTNAGKSTDANHTQRPSFRKK